MTKTPRTAVLALSLAVALILPACSPKADAQTVSPAEGAPYVLTGTQVWSVPDPVSGRDYEVFVSLPASYEAEPNRRYPVLYVTAVAATIRRRPTARAVRVTPFTAAARPIRPT